MGVQYWPETEGSCKILMSCLRSSCYDFAYALDSKEGGNVTVMSITNAGVTQLLNEVTGHPEQSPTKGQA